MRNVFILATFVLLGGCVRVTRAGFDNTTHTTTYCGNRWAGQRDIEEAAKRECTEGRSSTLRCGRQQVGVYAQSTTNSYGTTTTASPVYGTCCDFRCGDGG
jgi:hypothetical protein